MGEFDAEFPPSALYILLLFEFFYCVVMYDFLNNNKLGRLRDVGWLGWK